MTKSRVAQFLGVSVKSPSLLQYQSHPAILRRCGNTSQRLYTHSAFVSQHCLRFTLLRSRIRLPHYSPTSLTLSSCSRSNSTLGLFDPRSPSKQTTLQKSERRHRQEFYKLPESNTRYLRSGFGSYTAAAAVCIAILLYSTTLGGIGQNHSEKEQSHTPHETVDVIKETNNMTGEALPGRPGTLTPEQDEKLKEFWIATLQVFGVLDAKDAANGHAEIPNGKPRSDTIGSSKKPKKKRLSMFRSKNKEDDTDSATSTDSHHVADADDKYGQTKEFHEALANMSPEVLRATFWSMVKHDHPDALLLRFLRARKWNVENALVMMVSTMRWRAQEVNVDNDIMANGELGMLEDSNGTDPARKKLGRDFLAQMRLGKSFLHGLDISGRPMCFVRARLHKQGEQTEESLERYTIFIIESARMVLSPPVDTACIVFDLSGFSLANMDYAPVKFMIKCFEANYPESLGVVLVHKAPWVFQGIWKIIKGWLDPVVASKVHFTNNNDEMEEYVPRSQIIKELGGDEDWTYKFVEPVPGENDIMKDTTRRDELLKEREVYHTDYEKSTLDWIHETGDVVAVKAKRNQLANTLRDDYWRLDPYIRARSFYDRIGMINSGGRIQFYPGKETVAPVANGATNPVETSAADLD